MKDYLYLFDTLIKRHKKSEYTFMLGFQQGDTHLNPRQPSSRIREDLHVQGQGEDHQPGLDCHHGLCHHQPSLHGPRVLQTRNHLKLLVIHRHVPPEKCQIILFYPGVLNLGAQFSRRLLEYQSCQIHV